MIVAHDDKKHFHIHIMLNKVHMETSEHIRPIAIGSLSMPRCASLSETWLDTHAGPMRWDEESKKAVLQSRSERSASRSAQQQPTGAAAQFEHYQDQESFQSYVRREIALAFAHCLPGGMSHGMTASPSLEGPSQT